MKSTKIRIAAITLAAVAVIASVAVVLNNKPSQSDSVRIAGNLPLTGPIAAYSGNFPKGFLMGLEDFAKKANIPMERFKTDLQDNAGKPAQAATVVQKQSLEGFDVYLSGTSDPSGAVLPTVDPTNVPHFLVAFDAYMARGGENRLRLLPNYKAEAEMWLKYAELRRAKRIYMITLNNSATEEEFSKIVEPKLKSLGIEYSREKIDFGTNDFRTIAEKAKQFNADLVFVSSYSFQVKPTLDALRSLELINNGSVMATADFVDLIYNNTSRKELDGVAFSCPIFEVSGAVDGADEWRKAYEKRYGAKPTYVEAYAYDTAALIVTAFQKFGKVTTESIRKSLPLRGITGTIDLDKDGDVVSTLTIARLGPDGTVVDVLKK